MYKIFADNTLIYDSTLEDYKINKGSITHELNKSGSFTFSLYPDHFYYNKFVKLKTVITVYKNNKIVFRGRCLNDNSDYWNNNAITCEGELGFLQDSIIRPFEFNGTPEELFKLFINSHNSQVDEFKRFKIGKVTVIDPNNYIARENSGYESSLTNLNSKLVNSGLGGYLYITHGDDDTDEIPTINYLADFTTVSSQKIEFGVNLKNFVKNEKSENLATAIIPLGAQIESGDASDTDKPKLNITSVNNGLDYVYDENAVALRGWIFKPVEWPDVTDPNNLKRKALAHLADIVNLNVTIELTAIDLSLLDRSIDSYKVGYYIPCISEPHNFNAQMLCNKQTIDLLKPESDTVTLGYAYSTFTENTSKVNSAVNSIEYIRTSISKTNYKINELNSAVINTDKIAQETAQNYTVIVGDLSTMSGDLEALASAITTNAGNIATNAGNIATNAQEIEAIKERLAAIEA